MLRPHSPRVEKSLFLDAAELILDSRQLEVLVIQSWTYATLGFERMGLAPHSVTRWAWAPGSGLSESLVVSGEWGSASAVTNPTCRAIARWHGATPALTFRPFQYF